MKDNFHWNKAKETNRDLAKGEAKIKMVFIIQFENKQNQTAYSRNTHIQRNTSFRRDSLGSSKITKHNSSFVARGQVHASSSPFSISPTENMNFEQLKTIKTVEIAMKLHGQGGKIIVV